MTMMALKKVLLAKLEETYGSDPTPAPATETIDARKIELTNVGEMLERDNVRSHLSRVTSVLGQRHVEIKFECDLKGGGTKGTANQLGDLLQACGMSETASAGSSVTYVPYSVPVSTKSVTLYYYELGDANAVLRKITGARGTYEIQADAGQIPKILFTFKGIYNAPSDVTNPTGMVYETTLPPIVESSSFSLNSVTGLVVRTLQLAMNNELTRQDDINSAAGVKGFTITGRKPSGAFKPEAVNLATQNYDTLLTGNTETALSVVIGSASGNKLTITAPKCQVDNMGTEDQGGILYANVPIRLNASSGDDEISLKFE